MSPLSSARRCALMWFALIGTTTLHGLWWSTRRAISVNITLEYDAPVQALAESRGGTIDRLDADSDENGKMAPQDDKIKAQTDVAPKLNPQDEDDSNYDADASWMDEEEDDDDVDDHRDVCASVRNVTKPHFVIVGAQKAGTTALFELLGKHPRLQPSRRNETHFFDGRMPRRLKRKVRLGKATPRDWCAIRKWYSTFFRDMNKTDVEEEDVLYFEKTPIYLYLRSVPAVLKRTCPWLPKIIVMLRDPIERALSQYRMNYAKYLRDADLTMHDGDGIHRAIGNRYPSFERLIAREIAVLRHFNVTHAPQWRPDLLTASEHKLSHKFRLPNFESMGSYHPDQHEHLDALGRLFRKKVPANNYLHRGMYHAQLLNWRHRYSRDSMLVLNYDEFRNDPAATQRRIHDFLGVEHVVSAMERVRPAPESHYGVDDLLPPATRAYLERFFRPYNAKLAEILGPEWEGVWQYANGTSSPRSR